jgi:integrase
MRVPSDLVEHYGKKEFLFSLHTKDLSKANRKAKLEFSRYSDEFETLRSTSKLGRVEAMSAEQIRQVGQEFFHDLLEEDQAERKSGNRSESHECAMDVLEDHARLTYAGSGGISRKWMTTTTRNYLYRLDLNVPHNSELETELTFTITEASLRALELINHRNMGRFAPTQDRTPEAVLGHPERSPNKSGTLLSNIIQQYSQEQEIAGRWQGKTGLENRAIFTLFLEIIGDIDSAELGYPQTIAFKAALQRLPANVNKDPRYRGKSKREILEMPDVAPMSLTTVNKYLTRVYSLLDWALRHGYIKQNFAQGLSINQRRKASDARAMFNEEQIAAIFGAIAKKRVTASGKVSSFHYWAPLLGYLTGARVNELASLRLCDIHTDDDVPYIAITQQNDGEKATKTDSGKRNIPLHPALIRLGLRTYVETLRHQNYIRLFPELTLTKNGYGSKITSWFSGHNTKSDSFLWRHAGVTDDKLSFHSFRHTMATLLEQANIDKVLTKRILGHSLSDDVTYGRYSKGPAIHTMLSAITKAIPEAPLRALPTFETWLQGETPTEA